MSSPFEALGLGNTASLPELKSRWRELARKHHPDVGGDAAEFHKLHEAYVHAIEICESRPCEKCNGRGYLIRIRGFSSIHLVCPACGGDGR